jgi:segregation and condensation protein B
MSDISDEQRDVQAEALADPAEPVSTVEPTAEPAPESEPVASAIGGHVARAHLKGLIEALVFVSDKPLTVNELAKTAQADRKLVRALVDELKHETGSRGVVLDEVAGGLVYRSNAAYGAFIREASGKKPVRMSRAQLETLAIVAYRQPLTRPEVDEIRGVDSGAALKMLLERELVKILGKKDEPGRPLLYGTTPQFLEFFGLKSLKDLPTLREFTELSDDSKRTYERELGEAPAGYGAASASFGADETAAPQAAPDAAEETIAAEGTSHAEETSVPEEASVLEETSDAGEPAPGDEAASDAPESADDTAEDQPAGSS